MKKNIWAGIAILSLLLSACGNAPATPTTSAEDIQATAAVVASTMVAQTQAAAPTNTSVPPTDTPAPTDTPVPSPTAMEVIDASPTVVPTFTSLPTATLDPCNKPLTSWKGPTINLSVVYEYTPRSKDDKVILSLWVMSDLGECGFLYDLSKGPIGQYSALAYVEGAKDFKVSGGFRLNEASWAIVIRNNTIVAKGVCYPNC